MKISKKALFITLGAVAGTGVVIGVGAIVAVKLIDHGNTYPDYVAPEPKTKVYKWNNNEYTAAQLSQFLLDHDYKVDARSNNGLIKENLGDTYKFFKDESAYVGQKSPTVTKINSEREYVVTDAGRIYTNIPNASLKPSDFNPNNSGPVTWTAIRVFVDGQEYSYREFDGDATAPIGNAIAPKLKLVKESDVTAKNNNPIPFTETSETILSGDKFFSDDDKFATSILNFSSTTLTNFDSYAVGDQIGLDGEIYTIDNDNDGKGNYAYIVDKRTRFDLTKNIIRWESTKPATTDPVIKGYFHSTLKNLPLPQNIYRKITPSEVYEKMLTDKTPSASARDVEINLKDITIDGVKYQGYDYLPQLDKSIQEGWYKVSSKPDASTLLDENTDYYSWQVADGDFQKGNHQFNLYTSHDKLIAANKLTYIDTNKYSYIESSQSSSLDVAVGPLKNLTSLNLPNDEDSSDPIVWIDGERVWVLTN